MLCFSELLKRKVYYTILITKFTKIFFISNYTRLNIDFYYHYIFEFQNDKNRLHTFVMLLLFCLFHNEFYI